MATIQRPGQGRAAIEGKDPTFGKTVMGAMGGAGTGATIGSAVPGIGTAIGAGVGALVGGAGGYASGQSEKTEDQAAEAAPAQDVPQQSEGAMQRRMEQLDSTSRLKQLHESAQAVSGLTPEQRAQYGEPFMKGYMQELDNAVSKGYVKPGGMA